MGKLQEKCSKESTKLESLEKEVQEVIKMMLEMNEAQELDCDQIMDRILNSSKIEEEKPQEVSIDDVKAEVEALEKEVESLKQTLAKAEEEEDYDTAEQTAEALETKEAKLAELWPLLSAAPVSAPATDADKEPDIQAHESPSEEVKDPTPEEDKADDEPKPDQSELKEQNVEQQEVKDIPSIDDEQPSGELPAVEPEQTQADPVINEE